jgi:hypothetical protein
VPAGKGRKTLLQVADQLCAELGYEERDAGAPGALSGLDRDGGRMTDVLSAEDESLVATVRESLARVAARVGGEEAEDAPEDAISAALDGAEVVMRGELVNGNVEQLPFLIPSFVFLITLPIVEQDRALDLSRRTAELIERTLDSQIGPT